MNSSFSQEILEKTGDYLVDESIRALNALDANTIKNENWRLKEAFRPLFRRAAFMHDIHEDGWNYFLFAVGRTRDILEHYLPFIDQKELKTYKKALKQLKEIQLSFGKVYGDGFDIIKHSNTYYQQLDFIQNLPSNYYSSSLDEKRNNMVKKLKVTLKTINLVDF